MFRGQERIASQKSEGKVELSGAISLQTKYGIEAIKRLLKAESRESRLRLEKDFEPHDAFEAAMRHVAK